MGTDFSKLSSVHLSSMEPDTRPNLRIQVHDAKPIDGFDSRGRTSVYSGSVISKFATY